MVYSDHRKYNSPNCIERQHDNARPIPVSTQHSLLSDTALCLYISGVIPPPLNSSKGKHPTSRMQVIFVNVSHFFCNSSLECRYVSRTLFPPLVAFANLSPRMTLVDPPTKLLSSGFLTSDCKSPWALATIRTPLRGSQAKRKGLDV